MSDIVAQTPPKYEPGTRTFEQRQAELNAHGLGMAAAVSRGIPDMLATGAVTEATTTGDQRDGQVRYRTTQMGPDDYAGGWRVFQRDDGTTGLIRVTICQPAEGNPVPKGFVEVEVADPDFIGKTKLPAKERSVRVDVDEHAVPHVTGKRDGYKFDVDRPDPNTRHADFGMAESIFTDAAMGLRFLAGAAPNAVTSVQLPQA